MAIVSMTIPKFGEYYFNTRSRQLVFIPHSPKCEKRVLSMSSDYRDRLPSMVEETSLTESDCERMVAEVSPPATRATDFIRMIIERYKPKLT